MLSCSTKLCADFLYHHRKITSLRNAGQPLYGQWFSLCEPVWDHHHSSGYEPCHSSSYVLAGGSSGRKTIIVKSDNYAVKYYWDAVIFFVHSFWFLSAICYPRHHHCLSGFLSFLRVIFFSQHTYRSCFWSGLFFPVSLLLSAHPNLFVTSTHPLLSGGW